MTLASRVIPWVLLAASLGLAAFIWQDSRAQLEKKDQEIATLRAQTDRVVAEANSKIAEANTKYKQLVDEANQKIEQANQREVQVRIAFRKAFFSSGNVAAITNTSGQTVAIEVDVERPSSGQRRNFSLTLDNGQTKEIGEREGWAFISQDAITVSQAEHKALRFTAP